MVGHGIGAIIALIPLWLMIYPSPILSLYYLILGFFLLGAAALKKSARIGVWGALFFGLFIWTCLTPFGEILGRPEGRVTACKSNLKNLATALEMYSTDYHGRYAPRLELLTPNYLRTLPTCPAARDRMSVARVVILSPPATPYGAQLSQDSFLLYCSGTNHLNTSIQTPNFPQYDSHDGLTSGP